MSKPTKDASSHINTIFSLIEIESFNQKPRSTNVEQSCDIFDLVRNGDVNKVKKKLSQSPINANMRNFSHNGRTILQEACIRNQLSIVKLLLEHTTNIDLNKKSYVGEDTALHFAVYSGNKDLVKILLNNGADPNERNKFGATPFHYVDCREVADLLHYYFGAD